MADEGRPSVAWVVLDAEPQDIQWVAPLSSDANMSSCVSKSKKDASSAMNINRPWNAGLWQTHQMPLLLSPDKILASGYTGVLTSHFPLSGSLLIIPEPHSKY
jgi:hypothetical protein